MISENPSEHPMQIGGNTSHHQNSSTSIDYQFPLHLLWEKVMAFLLEEESPMAGVDRLLAITLVFVGSGHCNKGYPTFNHTLLCQS